MLRWEEALHCCLEILIKPFYSMQMTALALREFPMPINSSAKWICSRRIATPRPRMPCELYARFSPAE